jgi:hypothetical protein
MTTTASLPAPLSHERRWQVAYLSRRVLGPLGIVNPSSEFELRATVASLLHGLLLTGTLHAARPAFVRHRQANRDYLTTELGRPLVAAKIVEVIGRWTTVPEWLEEVLAADLVTAATN